MRISLTPFPPEDRFTHKYIYNRVDVLEFTDGDTVYVRVPGLFENEHKIRLRLVGMNAPEERGATREAGEASTRHLMSLVAEAEEICVRSYVNTRQRDVKSLERYVAQMWLRPRGGEWYNLSQRMIADGFATPYEV